MPPGPHVPAPGDTVCVVDWPPGHGRPPWFPFVFDVVVDRRSGQGFARVFGPGGPGEHWTHPHPTDPTSPAEFYHVNFVHLRPL